jgi:4-amino-4-deoxy-L-arabinose transferase-like glycosyltransferase
VVSIVLILTFVDPFIGDWDGLDYTILSLRGSPSSMALGRGLFTFFNHAIYVLAHALFKVQPRDAYLIFKYAVVVQGPLTVLMVWILARDLARSAQAATVAAFLLALSPVFVIYSGQVMTDVPSLFLLSAALVIHLRGLQKQKLWLVLIGAGLLGAGVNLRETVAFYGPWLVLAPFVCGWKWGRRELLLVALSVAIFFVFALGGFAGWYLGHEDYRWAWSVWLATMRKESAQHPVSLGILGPFLLYVFITAPLILLSLPFAFVREWRERRLSPVLLMALVGLFADLLLLTNYSTAVVWRYPLAALPALAPLTGDYFMRSLTARMHSKRLAFVASVGAIFFLAVLFGLYFQPVSRAYIAWRGLSKTYNVQLAKMPRDAVVIAGQQTVAVTYWRGVGEGDWQVIGTGSGWPGAGLAPLVAKHLKEGRRVFLDADPHWWLVCGWQREEIPELAKLEPQFHFRRVSENLYEIRPPDDASAVDIPKLSLLLPQNRPAEIRQCPPGRG